MSPQDKVERVLKEMHILFSKSLKDNEGMPDIMVVNRAEYMDLLDRLTNGIYEMMEEYEQTRASRMAAERSFRRNAEDIIDRANASAEDIYAASVLYTADAIGKVRALIDQTNDSMNSLFVQFRREMRNQKDLLQAHESELQSQLADLTDTRKYLSVLRDINREQERKNRDLEAEREIGNQYARNLFRAVTSPSEAKTGTREADPEPAEPPEPAPGIEAEVTVNRDAAYFRWKADQEADAETDVEAASGSAVTETAEGAQSVPSGEETTDAVYKQVPAGERKRLSPGRGAGQMGAGEVLKTILFGRDLE